MSFLVNMQKHRTLAGLIAGPAALLLGAGIAHAQATPAAQPDSTKPVELFKTFCVGGTAKLSGVTAVTYPAMPAEARAVIGKPDAEVPNKIYQINHGTEYLVIPQNGTGFQQTCAVVWKGDNLAEAQAMVPLAAAKDIVTATTVGGWIMLTLAPKPVKGKHIVIEHDEQK